MSTKIFTDKYKRSPDGQQKSFCAWWTKHTVPRSVTGASLCSPLMPMAEVENSGAGPKDPNDVLGCILLSVFH